MSPRRVSEKTLELNICAEILARIRSYPSCSRAFWIGMKQKQEAKNGIDELIRNVPAGMHLALQFKAPRSEPQNRIPYRFTINDRQNGNLLRLAAKRPDAVYYIFPHYNTFKKMCSDSPNLLNDTWLLRVYDLHGLSSSRNKQGTHIVETSPPTASVHSEPMEVEIVGTNDILGKIFGRREVLKTTLISHTLLKNWLRELINELEGNSWAVGQRLRGFSTFCIS